MNLLNEATVENATDSLHSAAIKSKYQTWIKKIQEGPFLFGHGDKELSVNFSTRTPTGKAINKATTIDIPLLGKSLALEFIDILGKNDYHLFAYVKHKQEDDNDNALAILMFEPFVTNSQTKSSTATRPLIQCRKVYVLANEFTKGNVERAIRDVYQLLNIHYKDA